jgi:hypothetical protein
VLADNIFVKFFNDFVGFKIHFPSLFRFLNERVIILQW